MVWRVPFGYPAIMPGIVVCAATELEVQNFPKTDMIGGRPVEVLITGVGPVNAAVALTRRLAVDDIGAVVCLGIGGAYPNSGLEIGDVVCAASEYYADLGAQTPSGFLDMEALGLAVVAGHFNRLPVGLFPAPKKAAFVTRSTCTGRRQEALEIEQRTGGAVESMEGAAVVHVALAHGIPVGEVRGISNDVGNRDRALWRIGDAARAATGALVRWIEGGAGKCR